MGKAESNAHLVNDDAEHEWKLGHPSSRFLLTRCRHDFKMAFPQQTDVFRLVKIQVIVAGKLRAQRAKSMKFRDGYMIKSGRVREGKYNLRSFRLVRNSYSLMYADGALVSTLLKCPRFLVSCQKMVRRLRRSPRQSCIAGGFATSYNCCRMLLSELTRWPFQ